MVTLEHIVKWLNVLLLICLVDVIADCENDYDCSLNGLCQNNACICDEQWYGEYCDLLKILPTIKNNGYRESNYSSWGGSIIYDNISNTYNMFVARMSLHCGLKSWTSNSEIVHAVSNNNNPLGPYQYKQTVLPRFAHNPSIHKYNNTYYLYHIGCGHNTTTPITNCTNGTTTTPPSQQQYINIKQDSCDQPHWTGLLNATSINGPWTAYKDEITLITNHRVNWTTNPAPLMLRNGTILMVYRQGASSWPYDPLNETSERLGISASNGYMYNGPFKDLTEYSPIETFPLEDPYIWQDFRMNYHMITHKKKPNYGPNDGSAGHLFSLDGLHWNISRNSPYNNSIIYNDGSHDTVTSRQRPQLLIENGRVKYVSSGVTWGHNTGDYTFTVVQPVYWSS